jgi:hypothetical protein
MAKPSRRIYAVAPNPFSILLQPITSRRNEGNIFILDLVYRHMFEAVIMADRVTNYATVSGFIVGLGVLLFVVRTRRLKGTTTATSGREDRKGKYDSSGRPVSD